MSGITQFPGAADGDKVGDVIIQTNVGNLWTRAADGAVFAKTGAAYPAANYPKAVLDDSLKVNGVTVTAPSNGSFYVYDLVTNGAGTIVAAFNIGTTILYSTDNGTTWDNATITITLGSGITAVVYHSGIGKFVAFENDAATVKAYTSVNGITWTDGGTAAVVNATSGTVRAACDGTNIVAVVQAIGTSNVVTTPDGITLTARTSANATPSQVQIGVNVAAGTRRWVFGEAANALNISTAANGSTWTSGNAEGNTDKIIGIAGGNGVTVIATTGIGAISNFHKAAYYTSTNNITWTRRYWPVTMDTSQNSYDLFFPPTQAIQHPSWLTFDGTRFVTGGGKVQTNFGTGVFGYSTDGINWSIRQLTYPATAGFLKVFSTGVHLVAGPAVSSDASIWQKSSNWVTSCDYVGKARPIVPFPIPANSYNTVVPTYYARIA